MAVAAHRHFAEPSWPGSVKRECSGASMQYGKLIQTWLILVALLCAGCGQSECEERRACMPAPPAPAAEDVVLQLQSGFVSISAGPGDESDHEPDSSLMVFAPPEADCLGIPDTPCHLLVKHFEIRFAHLKWELTTGDELLVDDALVSLARPADLQDFGGGYLLAAGETFQTCASVDGHRQSAQSTSSLTGHLTFIEPLSAFAIDATFPMVVRRNDEECSELAVTCRAQLTYLPATAR